MPKQCYWLKRDNSKWKAQISRKKSGEPEKKNGRPKRREMGNVKAPEEEKGAPGCQDKVRGVWPKKGC